MGKFKLDLDWDTLFPDDFHEMYGVKVPIRPLELGAISKVVRQVKDISSELSEADITFDNYKDKDKIISLVSIIIEKSPELLSEVTGVDLEDLKRLPLADNVVLFAKVIEVNLKSKDALIKNFESLTKSLESLTKEETPKE